MTFLYKLSIIYLVLEEVIMVLDKVREILAKQMNMSVDKIKPETNMATELGADSLDLVEILMTLEEEFSVSIPDDVALNLKTVQDLSDYIEKNKK